MKNTLIYVLIALSVLHLSCSDDQVILSSQASEPNAAKHLQKPYVVMVSIDGFRWDYPELHGAENIIRIGREGIRSERMLSSYPTKTFPNHYSLVTGMRPGEHGLVSNEFYSKKWDKRYKISDREAVEDGRWYGGVPLWSLAEAQGMRTASCFWVGSEAEIAGFRPSYYLKYNKDKSSEERISQVIDWLKMPEENRPHLITLYFSMVDNAGHDFGPQAPETATAVKEIDRVIGMLDEKLEALSLPVHLILVSDHGMTEVNQDAPVSLESLLTDGDFTITKSMPVMLYGGAKEENKTLTEQLNMQAGGRFFAYAKESLPDSLYPESHPHIGDIVLVPQPPFVFGEKRPSAATHGYYPGIMDMGAYFSAKGPSISSKEEQIPPFSNVHVFPLVSRLLGLEYSHEISGADSVLVPYVL